MWFSNSGARWRGSFETDIVSNWRVHKVHSASELINGILSALHYHSITFNPTDKVIKWNENQNPNQWTQIPWIKINQSHGFRFCCFIHLYAVGCNELLTIYVPIWNSKPRTSLELAQFKFSHRIKWKCVHIQCLYDPHVCWLFDVNVYSFHATFNFQLQNVLIINFQSWICEFICELWITEMVLTLHHNRVTTHCAHCSRF